MTRRYAIFHGARILLHEDAPTALPSSPPEGALPPPFGELDARWPDEGDRPALPVLEWPEDRDPPRGFAPTSLRAAFPLLGDELVEVGRAAHLLEWRRTHRYCGRCATPTELGPRGSVLTCPACGLHAFPRLAPAIIVLVHDGDRALLGRAPRYPEGMYSTLAGFVEPGETLEEAVAREVLEESGVTVGGTTYLGSQHWPFPHSLMLGFHARWTAGDPVVSDDELEDVRWFARDELPRIPPKESIAHRLIRAWVEGTE